MSPRTALLTRLLVALAVLLPAALISAPASGAAVTKWGDLGHFGDLESEIRNPQEAFGVNPEDGSVWVVDVIPVGPEEEDQFRLQRFEKTGSTWAPVASRMIGSKTAATGTEREVEGVAFDAKDKRAYILLTEERIKSPHKEEEAVASELLAFSTTPSGKAIAPATGTKTGGVLVPRTETDLEGNPVGKTEFSPNSTEKGMTLFAPGGITVNPMNDQILITGWIGGEVPEVWAVTDTGEINTVWEDKSGFFGKCGCVTAPVVTSAGKIFVLGDELQEITELPSNLSSAIAPKQAFLLPRVVECEFRLQNKEPPCPFIEKLTEIEDGNEEGGSMAIGPEGDFYVHVHVKNVGEGGFQDGAVMVLSPSMEELGWTGGGSWGSASKECAVNETDPGNLGPALVAGYNEHAFMFERGEAETEHSKVLELGPGGKAGNCPQGSATNPAAEVGGVKLSSFPIADNVSLSSKVTQANALSTEWEFEPSVTQTVTKRQQNTTVVEHQFKHEGTFTVAERIHTDDLATPLLETSEKVTIVAPKVQGEKALPEGSSVAALSAEVNPSGSPTKCEFQVTEASDTEYKAAGLKKVACPTNPGEVEKLVLEGVKVTGLTEGTRYRFRLLAKAGVWEGNQPGTEFELAAAGAPAVEAKAATEVGSTTATLNGTVNPKGKETKACTFEYGETLPSGKTASCSPSPGKVETPVAVSAKVTGLKASTAYKVKLSDESTEAKKAESSPVAFTTTEAPSAPTVETLAATGVTQTGVTLKGLVNPHGEETTCKFEYGTSTSYGTPVPCPTAPGKGRSNVEESVAISGLAAGTAYHFRIVAESPLGKPQGLDKEVRTAAPSSGGGGGGGGGGSTQTATTPPPAKAVLPIQTAKPVPNVSIAGAAMTVATGGGFSLKLSCPTEETSCSGTVTLKTLTAVAAQRAHVAKKSILTLAKGSFSIAAGKLKVLALHLNAKAKKLLAKLHTVRARVTIAARDPQGGTHTTTAVLTLKAAKKKKKKKH